MSYIKAYKKVLPKLLDLYPNAAAAYSLRLLRSGYTGAAIKVRRSSDNAETDIGFNTFNRLDTDALLSFVGSGDGFVSVWYDQSGEGNDGTNEILVRQPRIVNGGSVEVFNGRNNLLFGNISSFNLTTQIQPATVITLAKVDTVLTVNYLTWNASPQGGFFQNGTVANLNGIGFFDGAFKTTSIKNTDQNLSFFDYNGTNYDVSVNGDTPIALANSNKLFIEEISRYNPGGLSINGPYFEFIAYNNSQSANRTAIEANINNHYNIYTP